MRSSALVLLLPLAACFAPNPTFGLAPETSSTSAGSSETSAGTTPTTTLTTGMTTGMTTASGEGTQGATAGATSEPLTSTSEPATSEPATSEPATSEPATSDGTTLGDTGGDTMPACELFVGEEQIKLVLDFDSEEPITECAAPTKWYGRVIMNSGKLEMQDDPQCDDVDLNPDLILGEGWPSINDHTYKCAKATVYWNHVGDECRIAALSVVSYDPVNMVEPEPFFLARLSLPSKPATFPLWPEFEQLESCGCEDAEPCCAPDPDPGNYKLTIVNGPNIWPGDEEPYVLKDKNFRVKNIQSYVGPGCQDIPGTDIHFDWFAERTD